MAPTILIESLESLRRRVRILGVVFGIGLVATSAVALLLFTIFADYLLNLPAVPRLGLICAAVVLLGYAMWRWVIQSILARLTLNDVAGRVERTFPQFQDRLRSAIDILSGKELPGSQIMKQRVVSETARLSQSLDLNQVVVANPVWYSVLAGTGAVLFLGLLIGLSGPKYTKTAFDRLFSPFAAHPWPKTVNIDLVKDVPERVSVGQRIDVDMRLTLGDSATRKAIIYYAYGDESGTHFGPTEKEYMIRGDDGIYHAAIDARTPGDAAAGVIKVWMESGDDSKELAPIKVVQRLTISRVEAIITAPAYAHLPQAQHVNLSQNPGMLTFGSKVQLNVQFNKPLDSAHPVSAEIISGKTKPVFTWAAASGDSESATVDATDSFRFHLHATDTDGLSNTAAEEYEFVVRPDQNPTIVIENPRRNQDNTPEATVPLQTLAEDDFGIDSLTLVVDRINDKKHWEIPLVSKAGPASGVTWNRIDTNGELLRFRANWNWELASLPDAKLKPGDVLEYYALVKDNFELNGKSHAPVPSGKLRIAIISQDEFNTKIADMLSSVAEQVSTLRQQQQGTQRQTSELAKEVAGKAAMDNADKTAADRLANQQSTIASQTKSLATKMSDVQKQMDENKSNNAELKSTVKDVGDLLNSTAENPMKAAAGDLNDSKQQDNKKDQRDQDLTDAQQSQGKAADDLQNVLNRMGPIGQLQRSIDTVTDLLHAQQKISGDTSDAAKGNLGKTPDQMSPEDRAKLNDLSKQQADLGNKTQKTLDQLAKDADKLTKSDPTAAKAMQQAADTGTQQNVPGQQQKASDAEKENQQAAGQSSQKQAELGLQMMLADLKEAEKHKLDELARKLAELQQQVAILLRQQAEHNLDNLTLQGNDTLTAVAADVKLQLYTLSQRDPKAAPVVVELGMQSAQQEQTERNTRDIAKAAEDLPDGAGPADHLTRAADKMERAIVNLRDNKLATAYSPAQVDALTELLEAKKIIDQQKQKADDKQDQQKKEAIRQAYMKILADQNEVNAKTAAVAAVPRNEDGTLPRTAGQEKLWLGELPGDQGKVADQTAKLDEALQSLGSIVYSYANRAIVKNMNEVKDQLGKTQTGPITQAEQKQIVAQLDAMIKDLATKPLLSEFAQHKGGDQSGGGGGGSGMPSEAELRLMKDLQIAENDLTKAIAIQPNPQKADFLSLGNRQGDLRNLLDQLLQKASHNQAKLPPEPDNRDQLPEEAAKTPGGAAEAVDNKEMQDDLLGNGKVQKPGQPPAEAQHDLNLIGDRMSRSKQRLALNSDPGPVTQEIQKRILDNLDDLIDQARKREAQTQNTPPKPGGDPSQAQKPRDAQQPQNAQAQGQPQQGKPQASAGTSSGGGDAAPGDPAADIAKQEAQMWGSSSPRVRQAVIENKTEKVLDKYQKLVDDYYRTMATKANAH